VRQVRRIDLHGDREADLLGEQQGLGRGAGDHGLGNRHLEGAQDGLRFHLGKHLAAFGEQGLDQHLGAFGLRAAMLARRFRRLQQQFLVAVVLRDVVEQLDRRFRHAEGRNAGVFEQLARLATCSSPIQQQMSERFSLSATSMIAWRLPADRSSPAARA
jgi:hypothetical protein